MTSLEAMLLMSASTIEGTDAGEWISGIDGDSTILAGSGNDEIHAPIGNNIVDGGSGTDTFLVYEGNRSSYSLNQLDDGSWRLDGPGLNGQQVSNRLINVERVSFNDQIVTLGADSPSIPAEQVAVAAPSQSGSAAGEWLSGSAGNDSINAGAGDDSIHAPLGNNFIDGGSGFDTLIIYEGRQADYVINQLSNGDFQITGPGLNGQQQTNTIRSVEAIQFNDSVISPSAGQQTSTPAFDSQPATETFELLNQGFGQDIEPAPVSEPFISQESPQPESAPLTASSDFVNEVVRLTNVIRAENGLAPVTLNSELQAAASDHSDDMAVRDYFGHVNLDGQQPWDRALEAGYDYQTVGENIAAGQLTPAEVVQAWYESASHRENILNGDFTEIGIGYTFLGNDTGSLNFNHYWTQLFGRER